MLPENMMILLKTPGDKYKVRSGLRIVAVRDPTGSAPVSGYGTGPGTAKQVVKRTVTPSANSPVGDFSGTRQGWGAGWVYQSQIYFSNNGGGGVWELLLSTWDNTHGSSTPVQFK